MALCGAPHKANSRTGTKTAALPSLVHWLRKHAFIASGCCEAGSLAISKAWPTELESAKSQMEGVQVSLESEQNRAAQEAHRTDALSAKLENSTSLLAQRNQTIQEQDELLNHDRDIRELMGARDLYVVEVYDVEKNGKTRKPYGRMFYTKDKSVVFYAYDLDNQPGVRGASTFQAWGRSEHNSQQPLNLGIFYVDNASKKRWVLKFDDPKVLAQIDAVFVTVEPKGGSEKPTSKPLLFSYLHMDPNHP